VRHAATEPSGAAFSGATFSSTARSAGEAESRPRLYCRGEHPITLLNAVLKAHQVGELLCDQKPETSKAVCQTDRRHQGCRVRTRWL
jgi:hypothetical protein